MLAALMAEDHLPRAAKERMLLAVSESGRNAYGAALHGQMLGLLDAGTAQPDEPLVEFARKLAESPQETGAQDIEDLQRAGFTEAQIIETVVAAAFGRFLNTLQAGIGAAPDFAPRPLPAPQPRPAPPEKKVHPPGAEPRPMVEPDPDASLVDQARRGDMQAFETLVERHSQRVYRTLAALLGNQEEARDAMQDTFLKAYQNLALFEGRSKFSTWLVSIASNAALQMLRERRPLESIDDNGSGGEEFRPRQIRTWDDDPEQQYSKSEMRELLERHILRLPVKYRVVVMLRDLQQMPTEEAAAALGLGVPALKARLVRGRLMLRETLAPHFTAVGVQTA